MDANGRDVRSDGGAGGVDWAGRRQAERQLHGGRSLRKDRYSRIVGGMGVSGGGDVARNELAEPGDGGRRSQHGRSEAAGGGRESVRTFRTRMQGRVRELQGEIH